MDESYTRTPRVDYSRPYRSPARRCRLFETDLSYRTMPKSRPAHSYKRIAFVASDVPAAQRARRRLVQRYGDARPETADVVVALGGDGLMLATLQRFMNSGKPIYGMHRGTVGFLMNEYSERDLHKRLAELVADGIMLATPAGSTAYNLSVQGPIIPIGAPLLALTPISPFRPRRWHGALLPDRARICIEVLEPGKRPVAAVADHDEVRSVRTVDIHLDHATAMHMLFDPGHSLDERIIGEQFGH